MSDVPQITNFKLVFEQNFLSRTYIFSWDNITPPTNITVFYNIYLNEKLIARVENNFFKINSGVGCDHKCLKIKTEFLNNITHEVRTPICYAYLGKNES